ncbi:hypothetical protein O3P69_018079 [Scylla paramamosain]|uniref:Uncharacterized protein n=1 Tax=Scylla paramamosain TaxID=85552 RepID=A0AAW0TIR1_SCYPA
MRLTVVVAVAVLVGSAVAQLNVGPQGLSAPPINLISLFRFLRDAFNHFMGGDTSVAEEKQATGDVIQTLEDVAKKCLGDDHPCWPWLLDDNASDVQNVGIVEEWGNVFNLTDSRYVVTKWIMAYVAIIIVTSVLTLVIGYPYLITGQTFRSFHSLPFPDHQDSLLLLTWMLGEASGDESCLERVVCLNPERSARYLAVPNIFTSFFSSWVPVRYREQLGRLGDVTQNGLSHTCDQYLCPVLPNL